MRMDRNKNKPDLVFSSLPDILTVKDLQMALRIGKSTAYKLIQGGEIQRRRVHVPRYGFHHAVHG